MPGSERRRPRAATCEDWDEVTQQALPGSKTTANVAIKRSQQELIAKQDSQNVRHDGVDSGYASRADTLISESTNTSRRKMPGLKLDTAAIPERERQPYHLPQTPPLKSRRQSSSQAKDPAPEQRSVRTKTIVHERGSCWVCDQYGKHIDITKEMSRASSVAPPPPSPTATRQAAPKSAKDDDALPIKSRRSSSGRQPRPLSMIPNGAVPLQYINQAVYGPPVVSAPGWATPVTPSMPYSPVSYSYAPPGALPTHSFAPYQPMPSFYDQAPPPEPRSAKPSRRSSPVPKSSAYGDPVIRQGHHEPGMASLERVSSKENRPTPPSQKSARSTNNDRAIMPPPPKPNPSEIILARRPSNRRSKAYYPQEILPREPLSYEPDRFDEEDIEYRESRAPPSTLRGRKESASRPPTSYRAPAIIENRDRPTLPKKSVSYSTPTATTKVASSKPGHASRRTILPSVPLEQKEAEVEEYQKQTNNASNDLTVEALRDFNHRNSSSRSETGSSYSVKSRQSSSKDSSGRGRSHTRLTKTNITLPSGVSMSIPGGVSMNIPTDYMSKDGRPLSINFGGLVLSVGTEEKDSVEGIKEQKKTERASSVTSRTSKKSVSSSVISNRDKDRDREVSGQSSRRPSQSSRRASYVEERAPAVKTSGQNSRAPSVNGRSYEYTSRQSIDYSKGFDEAVYGA
ncbi:uncharacterized protein Z518_07475 [Rhinocladiella mackenziei CBS 650.93]|uniref:Uncharacterized protein n=1 Tax=Rhinocladiella mackenziei CBS 650.93 TaxID=1442369 RepID=A0A0D2FP70_9EURO|nr:uncharacterized protein Z518_07475 [Rhinocladiella mackenziei CBS 650.93]KIX03922.1 hypothetical protein Z518_07475 [Rhinocladiella mackenziei CBS 650.93]